MRSADFSHCEFWNHAPRNRSYKNHIYGSPNESYGWKAQEHAHPTCPRTPGRLIKCTNPLCNEVLSSGWLPTPILQNQWHIEQFTSHPIMFAMQYKCTNTGKQKLRHSASLSPLCLLREFSLLLMYLITYSSLTISCVAISALSSCSSTREVVLLSGGAPSSPPDTSIALSARISSSQTRRRSQHIPPAC